jgi:hypothetical protein
MVDQSGVKSIDRKNKTVEFDDGEIVPLPEDLAFEILGSKTAQDKKKRMSESVQQVQKGISNIPGGSSIGAFLSSAGESSIFPNLATKFLDYAGESIPSIFTGEGQEGMGYFERLGENVSAIRSGRREAKQAISAENPTASGLGMLTGIGADIAMPIKGLPKGQIAQGATLGGLYSLADDKSVLEDPVGVLKDVAIGSGVGAGIGAAGSKLEKIAQDRQALRNYPEILEKHRQATKAADKEFLIQLARKLDNIKTDIKGSGIFKEALSIDDFINKEIGMTSLGGSTEGNKLSSFIKSLEKSSPDYLNSDDVQRIFLAIEERIANSAPREGSILSNLRQHLTEQIPVGAASSAVKSKFGDRLINLIEKDVDKSVSAFLNDKKMVSDLKKLIGEKSIKNLADDIKKMIKSDYEKITPTQFLDEMNSGQLQSRIMSFFDNNTKIQDITNRLDNTLQQLQNIAPVAQLRNPEIQNLVKAKDHLNKMRLNLENNLTKYINNNSLSASIYEKDVIDRVNRKISNALGISPRTSNPRPVKTGDPLPPQVGATASFFETPDFYSTNAKKLASGLKYGYVPLTAMSYAAGLPKMGAAAGVGAATGGLISALRGVTSPTALGSFARNSIQKGGVRMVVESIADKYPSYQNGVLLDPQDRRAACAEIEQDQDLDLENKAMLQAKINRGINIESLIKEDNDGF